jgi:hypothetical protein
MSIAAWLGDQKTVLALMSGLRNDIARQFRKGPAVMLAVDQDQDRSFFQALAHALLCADIARAAGGDITPPPPQWREMVAAYVDQLALPREELNQQRFFLRALAGPEPWRSPAAARQFSGTDPVMQTYAWYFPTLVARDPRWDAGSP